MLEARDIIPELTEKSGAVKEAIPLVVVVASEMEPLKTPLVMERVRGAVPPEVVMLLEIVMIPLPLVIPIPVPAVRVDIVYPPEELPMSSCPC